MMPQQRQRRAPTATASPGRKKGGGGAGATTTSLRSSAASPLAVVVPLVLLIFSSWVPVAGGASSSSSLGLCIGKAQACSYDADCKECLGSWSLDNVDDECVADVEEVSSTTTGDCGTDGIQSCCGFESGTASTCMENTLLIEYWTCIQSGNGCDLDDLPCYGSDDDDDSAATASEEEIQAAGSGAGGRAPSTSGLLLSAGVFGAVVIASALV